MKEIVISADSSVIDYKIVDLDFPKKAIIAMIEREGNYLTPNGSTTLYANDKLVVLTDKKEILDDVYVALGIN